MLRPAQTARLRAEPLIDHQPVYLREGCVVIDTAASGGGWNALQMRRMARDAIDTMLAESPEFKLKPGDAGFEPVKGGFAALNHPSAYHHPLIRKVHEMIFAEVLKADAIPLRPGDLLEKCFDRVMLRPTSKQATRESAHRDEEQAQPGDTVNGGWFNASECMQYFSCALGSQKEVGTQNRGFAKITKEEAATYHWWRVPIPPGCIVIFNERLVHEVLSVKHNFPQYRFHLGIRVTRCTEPLFGRKRTREWLDEQAVPLLKSGQAPPMYPSCYYNFPANFEELTRWSERMFVPEALYVHKVTAGKAAGTTWTRAHQKMPSLKAMGLPMFPEYSESEKKMHFPSSEWELLTFDSAFEHDAKRKRFSLPSSDELSLYEELRSEMPDKKVRRPAPECEELEDASV